MTKVKVATDWLAGCAGCHMSFLDIDERIVKLLELVEFTSSPVSDLKHPPKEGVTVGILEGAICNSHNMLAIAPPLEASRLCAIYAARRKHYNALT
jgi:NAD-reducing hydrogenase small subunit